MLAIPDHIPIGDIEYLFTANQAVIENEAKIATLAMKPATSQELVRLYAETFDEMMSEVIKNYYKGELDD